MSDFEDRIKRMFEENVEHGLGGRRPAPPFVRPADLRTGRGSRRARWIAPLLTAACVALVAGATAGTVQLLSDKRPVSTQPPPPPSNSPSISVAPSPTTRSPSTSTNKKEHHRQIGAGSTSGNAAPPANVVHLAGARIVLPSGWVARSYRHDGVYPGPQGWCLSPKSLPTDNALPPQEYVPPNTPGCPIVFGRYDVGTPLDADRIPGDSANAEQCKSGFALRAQYADKQFGGRTADWRYYQLRCNSTHAVLEHYEVLGDPAMVMFSLLDTPQTHSAMASIAAQSTLPAQTRPLRLADRGYVRSVHKTSAGIEITLDRVVVTDKIINNNPETYTYDIPRRLVRGAVHVGDYVADLQTDGERVTTFVDQG